MRVSLNYLNFGAIFMNTIRRPKRQSIFDSESNRPILTVMIESVPFCYTLLLTVIHI